MHHTRRQLIFVNFLPVSSDQSSASYHPTHAQYVILMLTCISLGIREPHTHPACGTYQSPRINLLLSHNKMDSLPQRIMFDVMHKCLRLLSLSLLLLLLCADKINHNYDPVQWTTQIWCPAPKVNAMMEGHECVWQIGVWQWHTRLTVCDIFSILNGWALSHWCC